MEQFFCRTRIVSGAGSLACLAQLHIKRLLIVADPYFYENGTANHIAHISEAEHVEVFSRVAPDPTVALAAEGTQMVQTFQPDTILALGGAAALKSANIGLIPLIIIFVLFTAFMNLFMGSASAKWNIMAPVFVPMFMLLGYSPELCQLAYRVGDSCTNIITPLMTYYAVIIIFAQKYDKKAGIGTVTATMLPYSICFLVCWTIMLILWLTVGLPIGVNTPLFYPVA